MCVCVFCNKLKFPIEILINFASFCKPPLVLIPRGQVKCSLFYKTYLCLPLLFLLKPKNVFLSPGIKFVFYNRLRLWTGERREAMSQRLLLELAISPPTKVKL